MAHSHDDRSSLVPAGTSGEDRLWRSVLSLLERVPQAALSRALGRLADLPLPGLLRPTLLGTFARLVGIDTTEVEQPLDAYRSFNAFFVRRLAPGARPISKVAGLVSPVDGIVGRTGRIVEGGAIQAKGLTYAVADLLDAPQEAQRFEGGNFLTIYLSPRHYHRIHAPVEGVITGARHVPGALLPVNAPAVRNVRDLFARNERVTAHIHGSLGRVAVVAVGAYNVGRISAAFDPEWAGPDRPWLTNRADPPARERRYDPPLPVGRGDEIMAFHLGSTVVILTEPGAVELLETCRTGREVRVGVLLARPADHEAGERSASGR